MSQLLRPPPPPPPDYQQSGCGCRDTPALDPATFAEPASACGSLCRAAVVVTLMVTPQRSRGSLGAGNGRLCRQQVPRFLIQFMQYVCQCICVYVFMYVHLYMRINKHAYTSPYTNKDTVSHAHATCNYLGFRVLFTWMICE